MQSIAGVKKVPTSPQEVVPGALSEKGYESLCELLKARSGVSLNPEQAYFFDSRLLPVARENSLKDMEELLSAVQAGRPGLATQVVNALLTHETFFFRDSKLFEAFEKSFLPFLKKTRQQEKKLKVWCAACSSGQEAYSLAMIMHEKREEFKSWSIDILGTDLSPAMIKKAKRARFTQFEVQRGLPEAYLSKYFKENDCEWQLASDVRNKVKFQIRNLIDDFQDLGSFDVIFCRNVLVYFDPPTKARVLEKISKVLAPDGFLVLGASETVLGFSSLYKGVEGKRGIYKVSE